jgi:hypothetical protein
MKADEQHQLPPPPLHSRDRESQALSAEVRELRAAAFVMTARRILQRLAGPRAGFAARPRCSSSAGVEEISLELQRGKGLRRWASQTASTSNVATIPSQRHRQVAQKRRRPCRLRTKRLLLPCVAIGSPTPRERPCRNLLSQQGPARSAGAISARGSHQARV